MNKIWLILRHEVLTLVLRFSFWFGAVGVPLIAFGIYSIVAMINNNQGAQQESPVGFITEMFEEPDKDLPKGFVDPGGIIARMPPDPEGKLPVRYDTEAAALQALEAGELSVYYLIDPDYVNNGGLTVVTHEFNPVVLGDRGDLNWMLQYNLLEGNLDLADRVNNPMRIEEVPLAGQQGRTQDNPLTFFLPYAITLIFYIVILGTATLMLNSVSKEKENRVMEVLLLSASPSQLMAGKLIGLGLVGLFQILLWVGSMLMLLRLGGRTFDLPQAFQLDPSLLGWGVLYFILGYMLYAALMAGVGALVPNLREASQVSFLVSIPLIIPLILVSVLISDPHGWLAVTLSLIPFTSPVVMMLRLAATTVPLWQILLSLVLLIGGAWLTIHAAAGMFRAQSLLSGQSFKMRTFFAALIGRA